MNDAIVTDPMPIWLWMLSVWIFAAALLTFLYVLLVKGSAIAAWLRRTFTLRAVH